MLNIINKIYEYGDQLSELPNTLTESEKDTIRNNIVQLLNELNEKIAKSLDKKLIVIVHKYMPLKHITTTQLGQEHLSMFLEDYLKELKNAIKGE